MRLPARLALVALPLLTASPAWAGGLGITAGGGAHKELLRYYDAEGIQYLNTQYRPNVGSGLEILLGDMHDRIQGVARVSWVMDYGPTDPPSPIVDDPVYALPDSPAHIGVLTVGAEWGFFGDPTALQAHAAANLGGAIVTVDNTQYLTGEAGVGATWQIAEQVEVFGDAMFALRYSKERFYPGGTGYVGVRYLFD